MYVFWLALAYLPIYLTDVGLSKFQVSLLISLLSFAPIFLTLPFGLFSDILSPKKLVILGLGLSILFFLGLRYTADFWLLFLLFLLGGIGSSLFLIANPTLFYKFLGEEHRATKLGFFHGFRLLGYGLGPLTGGHLLGRGGMSLLFGLALALLGLLLLLSFFLEDAEPVKFRLADYRQDVTSKEMAILVALTFLVSLHLGVERTCLSLFLEHNIGLVWTEIGHMFFFIGLGIAGMSVVNGLVEDSASARGRTLGSFLYLGVLFSGFFNVSLLWTHSFGSVLLVRLAHVLGDSLFLVARATIIANLFPQERIGGNLGLLQMVLMLGTFVGALMSGFIPGYLYPFVFAGSVAILSLSAVLLAKPRF